MIFGDKEVTLESADKWLMPNFSSPSIHRNNAGVLLAQLAVHMDEQLQGEFQDLHNLRQSGFELDQAMELAARPEVSYLARTILELKTWHESAVLMRTRTKE